MTSVLPPDKAVVLIVEDEPFVRMMVYELFADEGFEVLEAESADEALAIFSQRDDVSLLFTDVEMPGTLNGYALARWAFVHRPTVKTLIVSGRALPSAGDVPDGAFFVGKPFTPFDVMQRVQQLMRTTTSP